MRALSHHAAAVVVAAILLAPLAVRADAARIGERSVGAAIGGGAPVSRGHLRVEAGGVLTPTVAIALSTRLGFPREGLDGGVGAPAGMVRVYRRWPSGPRVHATAGVGLFGPPVTGPLLLGGGAGYALRVADSLRVVVDVTAIAAIAVVDEIRGVSVDHGLHLEADVGLSLVW